MKFEERAVELLRYLDRIPEHRGIKKILTIRTALEAAYSAGYTQGRIDAFNSTVPDAPGLDKPPEVC